MKKVKISQDLGQRAGKVEKGGVPWEQNCAKSLEKER